MAGSDITLSSCVCSQNVPPPCRVIRVWSPHVCTLMCAPSCVHIYTLISHVDKVPSGFGCFKKQRPVLTIRKAEPWWIHHLHEYFSMLFSYINERDGELLKDTTVTDVETELYSRSWADFTGMQRNDVQRSYWWIWLVMFETRSPAEDQKHPKGTFHVSGRTTRSSSRITDCASFLFKEQMFVITCEALTRGLGARFLKETLVDFDPVSGGL